MNASSNEYDISVIVVTYNSSFEKLKFTLDSIVIQKHTRLEIIIADDGSKDNHFEELECFFLDKSFTAYMLLGSDQNNGTVKNLCRATQVARGHLIKAISPGDALIGDNLLAEWSQCLLESGMGWSFCRVVDYKRKSDGDIEIISGVANPQNVSVYEKNIESKCRWNYTVVGDVANGASIICKRALLLEYLNLIKDKVIYAEDNVFRIMMFNDLVALYYPVDGILYEYGDGISTSGNSSWREKIDRDWQVSDDVILNEILNCDRFQLKMKRSIKRQHKTNNVVQILATYLVHGRLLHNLKMRFCPRKTECRKIKI